MSELSVILLAAGYGTRMYPLTEACPKALLPLGNGVILDWILEVVETIPGLSEVLLVSNHRFFPQFKAWQQAGQRRLHVLDDGTSTPQTRLGAVRDIGVALDHMTPGNDALVLGTDNVFTFSLSDFVACAKRKRPAASVALRQVASREEARRYAVVECDAKARLVRCVEKPALASSSTVGLCVYYFPHPMHGRLHDFVQGGGNPDAPGYFIEWLVAHDCVYGYLTAGEWFDIGSPETYHHMVQQWLQHWLPRRQQRLSTAGG